MLLEPGSEFIVTGSVCFNGTWVVNLEQTPSTNTIVPFSGLFVGLFYVVSLIVANFFMVSFLRVFTSSQTLLVT